MLLLNDFDTTVRRAFEEIDPKWESYEGLIVCGSHSPKDPEKQIEVLRMAREGNLPTLGICFGFQLMAIEYAKNVLGIKKATSEEFGKGVKVVYKLPGFRVGILPVRNRMETHWHQYAVDPKYLGGWEIIEEGGIPEIATLNSRQFYVGVQFHPEYNSSKWDPHPLLEDFLDNCK